MAIEILCYSSKVKTVRAWKQDKDGEEGYMVGYEEGTYPFWMPTHAFNEMFTLEQDKEAIA